MSFRRTDKGPPRYLCLVSARQRERGPNGKTAFRNPDSILYHDCSCISFRKDRPSTASSPGGRIDVLFRIALRSKSSIADKNLELAFSKHSGTLYIESLERDLFRHNRKLRAEFLRFPALSECWLRDRLSQGVLAFIAHFGNWEFLSRRFSHEIMAPIHVVTGKIRDLTG